MAGLPLKKPETYFEGDDLKAGIFKDLIIKLDDVFKDLNA